MYCRINCGCIEGAEGVLCCVEADVSNGLPVFDMVGLLASEVREARERVKIAIKNSGYVIPPKRITINLSPADVRKEGTGFDLAIAIAVLSASEIISQDLVKDYLIIGELGLDGSIRAVNGVMPIVFKAKEMGVKNVVVSSSNGKEAAFIEGVNVYAFDNIKEVVRFFNGENDTKKIEVNKDIFINDAYNMKKLDFCDVVGQETAKRALEIAVAGMHNILLIGSPGTGKTMLSRRIPWIMPDLTLKESISVSQIYSIAGLIDENKGVICTRPFRAPHHSITPTALAGGGSHPKPGEVSLAAKGVLFLDELAEFNKNTLEILRQPLEDRWINVSRLSGSYKFPADFLLVCAMNDTTTRLIQFNG